MVDDRVGCTWRTGRLETIIQPSENYAFVLDEPASLNVVRPMEGMRFRGWVYLQQVQLSILISINGAEVARGECNISRPRVADVVGDPTAICCGFDVEIPGNVIFEGKVDLQIMDEFGKIHAIYRARFHKFEISARMVFIHIPKTAGSTINEFMMKRLGRNECAIHLESNRHWNASWEIHSSLAQKSFLSGHIRLLAVRQRLDLAGSVLTTVLRDPVEQLASHIAWARRLAEPGESFRFFRHDKLIQEISLDLARRDLSSPKELGSWVQNLPKEPRSFFDNCQVRYLATRAQIDQVNSSDRRTAVDALQLFDVVGRNDCIASFLQEVSGRMNLRGVPEDYEQRVNVAASKYGLNSNDSATRSALEPFTHHDEELYSAALAIAPS